MSFVDVDFVFGYGVLIGCDVFGWNFVEVFVLFGDCVCVFDDLYLLVKVVVEVVCLGDYVFVMSNGGFGGVY